MIGNLNSIMNAVLLINIISINTSISFLADVCLLWRHFRQFMSGSLRGGPSQTQHTSSPLAETGKERERGKERIERTERKLERETERKKER